MASGYMSLRSAAMEKAFALMLVSLAALMIGGCAPQPPVDQANADELALAIKAFGPDVDAAEAERAATIAYEYSLQLAQEYRITDSPAIHNAKVKNGLRERGLCNHFVEDILKRMDQEDFTTLKLQWAASSPKTFQIAHYTAVISRRGDTIYDGIVLDPWRFGGDLYWAPTDADETYEWQSIKEAGSGSTP